MDTLVLKGNDFVPRKRRRLDSQYQDCVICASGMIQRSEQEHHDHGHARLCCSSEYAVSNGFLSELPLQVAPDGEEQITDIPLYSAELYRRPQTSNEAIRLEFAPDEKSAKVLSCANGACLGILKGKDTTVLSSIASVQNMFIQSMLQRNEQKPLTLCLSAIIYGPLEQFNEVGEYLAEMCYYLQEPYHCDRNVKYRNPHRLNGLDQSVPMTFELHHKDEAIEVTAGVMEKPIDVLSSFESNQRIVEAESPRAIKTSLYSHQKQALSFMLSREQGWSFESGTDVWSKTYDASGAVCYRNNIAAQIQYDEPAPLRGGILADEMGLGKTLTVIGLIASDAVHGCGTQVGVRQRATLLIVPSSLLDIWEAELRAHVHPDELRWIRHHGNSKIQRYSDITAAKYDLILTTPMTVLYEYRKCSHKSSVLFSNCWHRVVIDEAHCIRNLRTLSSKAITAIEATRRWAVTGTPIQNRLSDFVSLLRFLKAYPYDSKDVFESDIIRPWNMEEGEDPTRRLRMLAQAIMLRRPKTKIELPKRHEKVLWLTLPPTETELYNRIDTAIAQSLENDLEAEQLPAQSYTNALMKVNLLRRVCDIGLHAYPDVDRLVQAHINQTSQSLEWTVVEAQESLENLNAFGPVYCIRCGLEYRAVADATNEAKNLSPQLTQCLNFFCGDCSDLSIQDDFCDHQPPCPVVSLSLSPSEPHSPQKIPKQEASTPPIELPWKIQAITKELEVVNDEKCVVFSFWRSTLDLVQSSLDSKGIRNIRVDGAIARQHRSCYFNQFRNDPGIRVLILTLSCGAEGLDLTAASRCYLLEPQWNPNLEEQALSRIHRLGQAHETTTVRFVTRGTVEEQMVELQNQKKDLAALMLSEAQTSSQQSSRTRLQHLRSLLR